MRRQLIALLVLGSAVFSLSSGQEKTGKDNTPPPGFTALFNGKDLTGWQGLIPINKRNKMSPEERAAAQKKADEKLNHWKVESGVLEYDGKGDHLCTVKDYGNFELYCDWKIDAGGDSGLYLRGYPQVQIWDPKKEGVGSGGLYNNAKKGKNPLVVADNPVGEWNTFYIKMVGDKVTVKLNGKLVVDDTVLENLFDRAQPLSKVGPIELQQHNSKLWFKNVYIKELE